MQLDWFSDEDVQTAAAKGPYGMVVAASAQFERWGDRLWDVLEQLTPCAAQLTCSDSGDSAIEAKCSTHALVALVHGTDSKVTHPPHNSSKFVLQTQIPSERFGMRSPYSNTSEFEVVVLRRLC